jgi:very-short-patch-repair endonuclease
MSMHLTEVMRFAEPRSHLVTMSDLRDRLGLSRAQIARVRDDPGVMTLHPGVYLLGSLSPSHEQRAIAACLAYPYGAIGFGTGAGYYGLRRARKDQLDFVVTIGRRPRLADFRIHYASALDEVDVLELNNGLRLTRPPRLLADLAGELDDFGIRSMIEDALNKELCTVEALCEAADRLAGRGRAGSDRFRRMVHERDPAQRPVQSEHELRLAEALESAGIPVVRQHKVVLGSGRDAHLDLYVEESRLDIEVDHAHWHAAAIDVQRDKSRDLYVRLLGIEPVRVTDEDIEKRLKSTVAMLCRLHEMRLSQPAGGR